MKHPILKTKPPLWLALLLAASTGGLESDLAAQTNATKEAELTRVLSSMRLYNGRGTAESSRADEAPRMNRDAGGILRHLGASPGHAFLPPRTAPGQPGETARYFVQDNKALLGIVSSNIDVTAFQTRQSGARTFVRLQQTYKTLPVYGGQMAVQLNTNLGVEFLSSDLGLEVNGADAQPKWTTPTITAQRAVAIVSAKVVAESPGIPFTTTTPQLMVYAPSVFNATGPAQLVWEFKMGSEVEPDLDARWLVDAHSGQVAARHALSHSALNRQIRDSANTTAWPGTLIRSEGGPPSAIADVNSAYTFLGQCYNWFQNNHARDSYNGGGATINATVRYCPDADSCPWGNAQWNSSSGRMRFGSGFATDDVTGHEFTHAVTEFTSGLIYENQSGAINESLSDIFGEFIDLNNANGDDSAGVRWLMGEDLPNGAIRSMDFPDDQNDPDRVGSSDYVPSVPAGTGNNGNDFGGVHSNSGVNNKLCYLLVDGDTFNGWTVNGMGITLVADLYYEANANLLTSGSGWNDLFEALRQTAVNLGWNVDQRNNLYRACRAVEIASGNNLYVDGTVNCVVKNGVQNCSFFGGPFNTVVQGVSGAHPGDNLYIRGGTYGETVTFSEITTVRSYSGSAVIGD
ncbi:MAG: M4 family metallopeptidase [Akkermansiaceae bacterium]|nr:M4 family metallopeptidase [Verrucomicrobiales bacterium]